MDIDNTMTELQPTLNRMAEVFNKPEVTIDQTLAFTLALPFNVTRETELDFWHTYEEELCLTAQYSKKRVQNILNEYTDKDTTITIMTSRDPIYHDATLKWLSDNAIVCDELVCVGKTSKVLLLEKMNADAVFEDNPDFFYELWDYGLFSNIDTYCIDYPYNKNVPCTLRLDRETGSVISEGPFSIDDLTYTWPVIERND